MARSLVTTAIAVAGLTALFGWLGWLAGGREGVILALLVAGVGNVVAWWNSGKLVRRMQGAVLLPPHQAPWLHEMVAALAARAGIPVPDLYVMENAQPNAFATGRSPEEGAICLTTGLIGALDRRELAGVVAHEMAHIRNRDTALMTFIATVAGAISFLAQWLFWFGGARVAMGGMTMLLAILTAPFAALLIRMVVSRSREYAADRLGAAITGDPLALASALRKIEALGKRFRLGRAWRHPALGHLYIAMPWREGTAALAALFATHPPMERRVRALEAMAQAEDAR